MKTRALIITGAIAAGAVATGALAAPAGKLSGTVGPGFTISLTSGGKAVKTLKAGKFSLSVADKSNIHNFHITGPGVDKEVTTVPATGTKTVTLTLKKGTYTYVCDPHASAMKGSFTVK